MEEKKYKLRYIIRNFYYKIIKKLKNVEYKIMFDIF